MSNLPTSIPIVGLPASDPTPGVFLEIDFAQGPASAAGAIYAALLMANKIATGDATVDSVVYGPFGNSPAPFATETDIISRSGRGSEMHRKWKRFVRTNGATPVFGIFVSESAGSKATLQINIGGADASSAGTMRAFFVGESVDANVSSGDSAATVVASLVAAVNTQGDWPATAAANVTTLSGTVSITNGSAAITFSGNQTLAAGTAIVFAAQPGTTYYLLNAVNAATAGTLTVNYGGTTNAATTTTVQAVILTAKQKGPRGNWLRASAQLITGAGTTSFVTAQTFFTGGTTADSNVTALATINSSHYYYLVPAAEDTTQLGALSAQVSIQAQSKPGIRQTIVAASIDTESNAQTIAITLNQARAEYVWMEKSDWVPSEMAAHHASLYSLGEAPDGVGGPSLHNFNGLGGGPGGGGGNPARAQLDPLYAVPYPRGWTAKPTATTIVGAIQNGLSPVTADSNGNTYLVMRVTTRTLTSGITDYRIRWPHKVRVCDFYGDQLVAKLGLQFGGMDIIDNPVTGQRIPNNRVTWPSAIEASVDKLTDDFGDDGQFQNAAGIKANTQVIREASPTTRCSVRVPASTIDTLDQIAIQLLQVA
jgi:phage tail sheath gpL-like